AQARRAAGDQGELVGVRRLAAVFTDLLLRRVDLLLRAALVALHQADDELRGEPAELRLAEGEGGGGRDEPRVVAAERGGPFTVDLVVATVDDCLPGKLDRHRAHARRRTDRRDGGGRLADGLVVLPLADVLAAVLGIRGRQLALGALGVAAEDALRVLAGGLPHLGLALLGHGVGRE